MEDIVLPLRLRARQLPRGRRRLQWMGPVAYIVLLDAPATGIRRRPGLRPPQGALGALGVGALDVGARNGVYVPTCSAL